MTDREFLEHVAALRNDGDCEDHGDTSQCPSECSGENIVDFDHDMSPVDYINLIDMARNLLDARKAVRS